MEREGAHVDLPFGKLTAGHSCTAGPYDTSNMLRDQATNDTVVLRMHTYILLQSQASHQQRLSRPCAHLSSSASSVEAALPSFLTQRNAWRLKIPKNTPTWRRALRKHVHAKATALDARHTGGAKQWEKEDHCQGLGSGCSAVGRSCKSACSEKGGIVGTDSGGMAAEKHNAQILAARPQAQRKKASKKTWTLANEAAMTTLDKGNTVTAPDQLHQRVLLALRRHVAAGRK
eukprot:1473224-Amphidinium_carterae.1